MNSLFLYGLSLALLFGPVAAVLVQTAATLPVRDAIKSASAVAIADTLILLIFSAASDLLSEHLSESANVLLFGTLAILSSCYLMKIGVALVVQSAAEQLSANKISWKSLFLITLTNPGTAITTASVVAATKHSSNTSALLSELLYYFAGSLLGQCLYLILGSLVKLGKKKAGKCLQLSFEILGGAYIVAASVMSILGNVGVILKNE
jgi:threonine/homoserine/homoserine lactone efflux protein